MPAWVQHPLGKYHYLYFSHHAGKYIRLACICRSNRGLPGSCSPAGVMQLSEQYCAVSGSSSPLRTAIVDQTRSRSSCSFYGLSRPAWFQKLPPGERDPEAGQVSSFATSSDGVHFRARPRSKWAPPICASSLTTAPGTPPQREDTGTRAATRFQPFTPVADVIGPEIAAQVDPVKLGRTWRPWRTGRKLDPDFRYLIRHVGIDIFDGHLLVYFSCVGHRPERILSTSIEMKGDPAKWRAQGVMEVLRPDTEWEGVETSTGVFQGRTLRTLGAGTARSRRSLWTKASATSSIQPPANMVWRWRNSPTREFIEAAKLPGRSRPVCSGSRRGFRSPTGIRAAG